MRKFVAIMAAACLFGLAGPADAAFTQLKISGTVVGTQTTIQCGIGGTCSYPSPLLTQSYAANFTQALMPFDLKEGDNSFTHGALSGIGLYSGVINYSNGVLTGRNLTFTFEIPGVRSGTVGSSYITANATTFSVAAIAPVPEPGTWALMLFGFGAVGTALRRAPRRTLQPA